MQLAADDLTCVRGGRLVFSGLSFAVDGGRGLAVTGPNGAGKSSLLRMVAGLIRPERGAIALRSGDPERTVGEQAHYLGHQDALKPSLTVAENIRFWTRYLGASGGAEPQSALATVGLAAVATLPAGYLSAGQRRRLSLARLLTVRRPLWLLDEPTAALDAAAQALLAGLMRDHLEGGGIIVAATHGPLGLDGMTDLRLGHAMDTAA